MERLLKLSEKSVHAIKPDFKRYLYDEIDWGQPLSVITGARGAGKTTMLLQKMKTIKNGAIYLSLDDFYFESNRFLLLAENLYEQGFRYFFLDEVHQYPHWSKDIKNFYDRFPDIRIVATGSSVLKINIGQADLSRRANVYHLNGLSFREFLELDRQEKFDPVDLEQLLKHHQEISPDINDRINSLQLFGQYLNHGYYPFYRNDKASYHQKLQQIIRLITEIDIPSVEPISYATIRSMKKLFFIISQSVPFTPNIQSLSDKLGVPRNSILKVLDLLERGQVLNLLRSSNHGVSYLQKPERIFLENPNLAYTFSGEKPEAGNLRETFFLNQLKVKHSITSSKFADFMVDDTFTFEIGGPSKTGRQIKGIPQAYIASDGLKGGIKNKIPLWLFGFLY